MKKDFTLGIVGLGLMGGAFARALREKYGIPQEKLFACDIDKNILNTAQEQGLVSKVFDTENAGAMLSACDVVFICLNPSAVICFLEKWSGSFKPGSIVTDIAGTKASIAAAAEKLGSKNAAFDFIPGHPMAGAEKGGFANSHLCNFTDKNYILTPLAFNKPENLEFLKQIIHKMGFNKITEVTPEEHDRKIAFTSQLCHIIASALIDCESDTEITRFGGGSFEDLTRIAMLNAPMWTEIFIENRSMLLERINQFEKSLNELKVLIGGSKAAELEKRLELVKERRTEMGKRG
ncbi:MAG: prephenate dehydrogenase [Treponema sp.]|jgi:prephenate dehydrogenase|nr:prephenate dehydrogenase [Treponema sp.]